MSSDTTSDTASVATASAGIESSGLSSDGPELRPGLTVLWDLGMVTRIATTLIDEATAAGGLDARTFFVVSLLAAQGDLTPTQIAERTGIPASSVSKVAKSLEGSGLVTQEPHPTDGRSRVVSLADTGRRAIAAVQPTFGDLLDRLYRLLGSEMADVMWSLRRLEWALRDIGGYPDHTPDTLRNRTPNWIRHSGPPLTDAEEREVLAYIDWIAHRRAVEV